MTDRETLREKAERVNTWGENWSTSFDDRTQVRDVYDRLVASVEGVDEADYIAAADPPTVLALLRDLARTEAEVERLNGVAIHGDIDGIEADEVELLGEVDHD